MRLQVIKQDGHYTIPFLEQCETSVESFYVEVDGDILAQMTKPVSNDTLQALLALNQAVGGDEYLEYKLKHLPADYLYVSAQTDEEILAEALHDKYAR